MCLRPAADEPEKPRIHAVVLSRQHQPLPLPLPLPLSLLVNFLAERFGGEVAR